MYIYYCTFIKVYFILAGVDKVHKVCIILFVYFIYMDMSMPKNKLSISKEINKFISEVMEIEKSDDEQRSKTRKFNSAGTKFYNAIYGDERRYRVRPGQEKNDKRITLKTVKSYVSKARKALDKEGLKHHMLDRRLTSMAKKYPYHAPSIEPLLEMDIDDVRINKKSLMADLEDSSKLADKIANLDFSEKATLRKLDKLAKRYPIYETPLQSLRETNSQEAYADLRKAIKDGDELLEELANLKTNHQAWYALTIPSTKTEEVKKFDKASLKRRNRNVTQIDYPSYMQKVYSILANPEQALGDGTMMGVAPLAFGIAAATGRRAIEVVCQGTFTVIDEHRFKFGGQAKKREESNSYTIYSLFDTGTIIKAIATLRNTPQVKDLASLSDEGLDSSNSRINDRIGESFNRYAKEFFANNDSMFKDSRSIYATICNETWRKSDPAWEGINTDEFYTAILGHEREETQLHYKAFELVNFSHDFDLVEPPKIQGKPPRLDRLAEFDDKVKELGRGTSGIDLHNKVKTMLRSDPDAKINQRNLEMPTGGFKQTKRDVVKRYMALCSEALDIELSPGGRWRDIVESPIMDISVIAGSDQSEALQEQPNETKAEAKKPAPKPPAPVEKPKAKAEPLEDGSGYRGEIILHGKIVSVAECSERDSAMRKAWKRYLEDVASRQGS